MKASEFVASRNALVRELHEQIDEAANEGQLYTGESAFVIHTQNKMVEYGDELAERLADWLLGADYMSDEWQGRFTEDSGQSS